MLQEDELERFLGTVCSAHPEVLDGKMNDRLRDMEQTMINISRLAALNSILKDQIAVVKKLHALAGRLDGSESSIEWATTGAMLIVPGLSGTLATLAAGKIVQGMVHRQAEIYRGAVTGPIALSDELCNELFKQSETIAAQMGEAMEEWFKSFEQLEAVTQCADRNAEASGWAVRKESLFGYDDAKRMIENNLAEETASYRSRLEESAARCNMSAAKAIQESTHQADVAATARTAAIASVASAAFSALAAKSASDAVAEVKKKDDPKEKRWSLNDMYQ